ncbi:dihydrofolate reductase family protein [Bizionia paragorgiae]|uniref:dihydrofolate reductase family protein n=1 Tax=Bizionia paragorgiae TaxID=283786 RepID=UPI003A945B5F
MRTLNSFTFITLNGYYKGKNEDTSWHKHGGEESQYSQESLQADNILLFGRTTYEMMYSFWPTPMAAEIFPEVAAGMNRAEKIVFSNSLQSADWNNSRIIRGNIAEEIRLLKTIPGKDLTILGSGSIVSQFSDAGLIDSYQILIDPLVLSEGTSLFDKLKKRLELKLVDSRIFDSGSVLLKYQKSS